LSTEAADEEESSDNRAKERTQKKEVDTESQVQQNEGKLTDALIQ
jgi:hypothetical protein